MIVFVDNEPKRCHGLPTGERLLAGRMKIKYLLEDLADMPCLIVHYSKISNDLLEEIGAKCLFVSGNSANPDAYSEEETAGLRSVYEAKSLPIFAFCGGFQALAETFGADLGIIGRIPPEEVVDDVEDFAPGLKKEIGYLSTDVISDHPLLEGLGESPVFFQAHSWEVKSVPDGFSNYVSSSISSIQFIVHDELPIVGAQFHPEYPTEECPDGRVLIQNFLTWANVR